MKVIDFLKVFRQGGAPFVRIIDTNIKPDPNNPKNGVGVMFGGWVANIPNLFREWEKYADCEVLEFHVTHEVSHKRYEELGLIPPYRKDITAEYEIGELLQKTYYDIVIDGKEVKKKT